MILSELVRNGYAEVRCGQDGLPECRITEEGHKRHEQEQAFVVQADRAKARLREIHDLPDFGMAVHLLCILEDEDLAVSYAKEHLLLADFLGWSANRARQAFKAAERRGMIQRTA